MSAAFPILSPENRWDLDRARNLSPLQLLTYRSNLLGADRSVANWGGGNTSCKTTELDFRERPTRVLWVKGSGSDLATIRPEQFTALRLEDVEPLFERDSMADEDLVGYYEHAGLRPGQPRASIETPLHSMLRFEHVDHTHPDAIIALCGVPTGPELARRLWGHRAIWVPWERPGFGLGKKIALAVAATPDAQCALMAKHGLVTWGDSAEACYASTIRLIQQAAEALAERADRRRVFATSTATEPFSPATTEHAPAAAAEHAPAATTEHGLAATTEDAPAATTEHGLAAAAEHAPTSIASTGSVPPLGNVRVAPGDAGQLDLLAALPALRGAVSKRQPMVLHLNSSPAACAFASRPDIAELTSAGPACPDHLVHTKPWPLLISPQAVAGGSATLAEAFRCGVDEFEMRYTQYAKKHGAAEARDPAPRVVVVPGAGVITTGRDATQAAVASALYERAIQVLMTTAGLGGFAPLTPTETFEVEYWPMELHKLSLAPRPRELAGRVALVTGGASGIGRAIAVRLAEAGAHVVVGDRNEAGAADVSAALVEAHGEGRGVAIGMDVTDEGSVRRAFEQTVLAYGGLDIVVSNAGISTSSPIEDTSLDEWNLNQRVLGTGYFLVAREAFRLLKAQAQGGSIVFVASKNGLVGGRNAAAYSSAKALEIHLARCLAEEGGAHGIRVNTVNPDAVLRGSGIWDSAWREQRAQTYGIDPNQLEEHYRARTTLKVNVLPEDVAEAVLFLASNRSAKSTGNILNVDGGVQAAYTR